jgi:peptide/nickel transport system permease protein
LSDIARLRRLIFSNYLSTFGVVTVSVFVVLALLELATFGRITPYSPYAANFQQTNAFPSLAHFFGTDFEGRDLFSQVIAALPVDIGVPLIVVFVSAVLGIALGTIAGYFRGWFDEVIMRVTDMFLAFPTIIMSLAVAATLGPSLLNATISLIFVWWPPYVRLVRGSMLEVAAEDFVSVSKALNSSLFYIIRKDAIPNILPNVLVYATTDIGAALLTLSTLGYLGIGIPPEMPELGKMVSSISYNLYTYPWQVIIPAVIVMAIVAGFSFLGEGLRESLDVKLRPHVLFRSKPLTEPTKDLPKQERSPPTTL